MRTRKYRAWDDVTKRMIYDFFFIDSDGCVWYDQDKYGLDMSGRRKIVITNGLHIMDYIGLKDKEQILIAEGDIISAPHFPKTLIVGFCRESASYGACIDDTMSIDKMYWFYNDIVLDQDDWYVIGNIYENPDLIPKN